MKYKCEQCHQPCGLRLYESGLSADCCEESYPLIEDDGLWRHLTAEEELDLIADLDADEPRSAAENARLNWLNRS
jgi:hypothetical protein